MRKLMASLACLSMAVAGLTTAVAAPADAAPKTIDIVLLGDSYTAGNGVRRAGLTNTQDSIRDDLCVRHSQNYGGRVATSLRSKGYRVNLTNAACSGDKLANVRSLIKSKPAYLSRSTDLVMLSIGGNDADFNRVVTRCLVPLPGFADAYNCEAAIKNAKGKIDAIVKDTEKLIYEIDAATGKSQTKIILVGYPLLTQHRTDYSVSSTGPNGAPHLYAPTAAIRSLGVDASNKQSRMVARLAGAGININYYSAAATFAGHEPDPRPSKTNSQRWINELRETGGWWNGKEIQANATNITSDKVHWFHTNTWGHYIEAQQIEARFLKNPGHLPK